MTHMQWKVVTFSTLHFFYLYAIGGGSPRKKAPKSAGSSKTHMPSVKTPADKKQEEVSCSNRLKKKKTDRL